MSVVVRDGRGRVWLLCKGADSAVFPNCQKTTHAQDTNKHLDDFANVSVLY